MKNIRPAFVLSLLLILSLAAYCQHGVLPPIAQKVTNARLSGAAFKQSSPFQVNTSLIKKQLSSQFAKDITFADLNLAEIANIYQAKDESITLILPYKNGSLYLDLVKVNLLAENFKVYSSENNLPVAYSPGLFYQGIISNDPSSVVAITIYPGAIAGTVSAINMGNINIGRSKKGLATDYLIYSDADVLVNPELGNCSTEMDPNYLEQYYQIMQNIEGNRDVKCPKIFFEADYDIFLNYGGASVIGTSDYIINLFNVVAAIFTNEMVSTEIQTIYVWSTPDTYSDLSSSDKLYSFSINRPTFEGDVAHLFAMYGGSGGIASTVNGLCNGYSYSVSWISGTYFEYPNYSWPVFVVTHELGHLFGSAHTQSCFAWIGGALDNCYTTEGGCAPGPAPIDGGTIMSYCHVTAYGVNFANGFGPQPGDAIRNTIAASYCIDACGIYEYNPYCYVYAFSSTSQWIQSVKMAGIASITGNNDGYGYFLGTTFFVQPGDSSIIKVTPGYLDAAIPVSVGIWIDFNQDGDFFDDGELVVNKTDITSTVTSTFYCASGLTGTTRMRILLKYGGPISTPCDIFFGEAEDYTVSFDIPVTYCNAAGLNATNNFIDYLKLNEINRISASDGGYYNGTALSANLTAGSAYSLTFSNGFTGITEQMYWRAWIDFNGDGDFSDSGEKVMQKKTTSAANFIKSITIPLTATPGNTRMRIISKFGGYPNPCESFATGEVEDYTINILPALASATTQEFEMLVFPNPASTQLQVKYSHSTGDGVSIDVFDLTGKQYFAEKINAQSGSIEINLTGLSSGIYLIKITQENGNSSIKHFVKM